MVIGNPAAVRQRFTKSLVIPDPLNGDESRVEYTSVPMDLVELSPRSRASARPG